MSIDLHASSTVEVGYDEFCGALAARDLRALWNLQKQLMPGVPLPATLPWLWKWDVVLPLAKRAGEIVTIERGGDRRVLAFANPGLNGLPFTSSTLWGAIQYLGPHESAPAHRHTPSAIRFVLAGSGASTTVNGDACDMNAGDLVLTPNWHWHDHNSESDDPIVWFDGLDLPLVTTLESIFFENNPELVQAVDGRNLSEATYGAVGLVSNRADAHRGRAHSPLLRYPRSQVERVLSLARPTPHEPVASVEYRDPVTGGPIMPTFTCEMVRLFPGSRTATRRRTGSAIYVVFSGEGRTVMNGTEMLWSAGDVFVAPSWAPVDHESFRESDVFVMTDRPVLEKLQLYREEVLDTAQEIERTFDAGDRPDPEAS
jgi:gentisate 1,2-dioxygenase